MKKKAPAVTKITEYAIWCRDATGRILLHCESGSRRKGLWKLPLRSAESCSALKMIFDTTYPITRYKVHLKVHEAETEPPANGEEWIAPERLGSLPVAAPFRKALNRLLSDF